MCVVNLEIISNSFHQTYAKCLRKRGNRGQEDIKKKEGLATITKIVSDIQLIWPLEHPDSHAKVLILMYTHNYQFINDNVRIISY